MLPQIPNTQSRQDLQATLAAWRELGPEYDDQFIAAVVDKLSQHLATQPGQGTVTSTSRQRHALAIISVVLLLGMAIPIAAVGGGIGLLVVSLAVVTVNLMFGRSPQTRGPAQP